MRLELLSQLPSVSPIFSAWTRQLQSWPDLGDTRVPDSEVGVWSTVNLVGTYPFSDAESSSCYQKGHVQEPFSKDGDTGRKAAETLRMWSSSSWKWSSMLINGHPECSSVCLIVFHSQAWLLRATECRRAFAVAAMLGK